MIPIVWVETNNQMVEWHGMTADDGRREVLDMWMYLAPRKSKVRFYRDRNAIASYGCMVKDGSKVYWMKMDARSYGMCFEVLPNGRLGRGTACGPAYP